MTSNMVWSVARLCRVPRERSHDRETEQGYGGLFHHPMASWYSELRSATVHLTCKTLSSGRKITMVPCSSVCYLSWRGQWFPMRSGKISRHIRRSKSLSVRKGHGKVVP